MDMSFDCERMRIRGLHYLISLSALFEPASMVPDSQNSSHDVKGLLHDRSKLAKP